MCTLSTSVHVCVYVCIHVCVCVCVCMCVCVRGIFLSVYTYITRKTNTHIRTHTGRITRITNFGAYMDVGCNVEAFLHCTQVWFLSFFSRHCVCVDTDLSIYTCVRLSIFICIDILYLSTYLYL